jgi:thiol-disulfide isomerase/thioredoxin
MTKIFVVVLLAFVLAIPAQAESLADQLKGDLAIIKGKNLRSAEATALDGKKIIAVYYSAHRCPPCRMFTPEFVKFYNENKEAHPEFEVIFMSSDNSPEGQEEYMATYPMPWLAVKYTKIERSPLMKYAGKSIPYMVVLDENGAILLPGAHAASQLPKLAELLKSSK